MVRGLYGPLPTRQWRFLKPEPDRMIHEFLFWREHPILDGD